MYYSDYLVHHGIKGQKWGVRRYQNPDGSLTRIGRKRYNKSLYKKIKKDSKNYKASYSRSNNKSFHLTDKQKKALKIGAAVVVTGLAVYGAYKLSNSRFTDKVITGKDVIYRMEQSGNNKLNELFYASISKKDAAKYFSKFHQLYGDNFSEMTLSPNKKIKIAGTRNASKIFDQWKIGTAYENQSYEDFNGTIAMLNKGLKDYGLKLDKTYAGPYFNKLREAGYSGLLDTQDKFANLPIIFINGDWHG